MPTLTGFSAKTTTISDTFTQSYKVPSEVSYSICRITICNTSNVAITLDMAVSSDSVPARKDYITRNLNLESKATFQRTYLVLAPNETIYTKTNMSGLSVRVEGHEQKTTSIGRFGLLGSVETIAGENILYTVPNNIPFATVCVSITNMSSSNCDIDVGVTNTTMALDPSSFIINEVNMPANSGLIEITNLVIKTGEKVIVKGDAAGLAVRVYGLEQTV